MNDRQIEEASQAAGQVVGISSYLHGIGYSVQEFKRELDRAVSHIRSQQGK
ncbi:MAG: hypothetical protein HY320_10565 [Armatimonadetes bacterium]|nr:hypothetical protein [Armatimonadota bacterium]